MPDLSAVIARHGKRARYRAKGMMTLRVENLPELDLLRTFPNLAVPLDVVLDGTHKKWIGKIQVNFHDGDEFVFSGVPNPEMVPMNRAARTICAAASSLWKVKAMIPEVPKRVRPTSACVAPLYDSPAMNGYPLPPVIRRILRELHAACMSGKAYGPDVIVTREELAEAQNYEIQCARMRDGKVCQLKEDGSYVHYEPDDPILLSPLSRLYVYGYSLVIKSNA